MTWVMGIYFWAIAYVLAQLEIQIEGPHGWAEKLPTWRLDSAAVLKWAGKPITGYHVYLTAFIVLFIHAPILSQSWSVEREAETLSLFFLLAVFWDFLWFVTNPHFGLARFNPGKVWWFKSWTLGFPTTYFTGLALSMAAYAAAGLIHPATMPWAERCTRWGMAFAVMLIPTLATVASSAIVARRRIEVAGMAKS